MSDSAPRLFAVLVGVLAALTLSACTPAAAPAGSSPAASTSKKPTTDPLPAPTIEPVIVVAAVDVDGKHVTASGYVQGLIEDGGTCTFVFSREGVAPVTAEHAGAADRSSTACGAVQPEIGSFVRGTWSVTLDYSSPSGTYHSRPQTVEVP